MGAAVGSLSQSMPDSSGMLDVDAGGGRGRYGTAGDGLGIVGAGDGRCVDGYGRSGHTSRNAGAPPLYPAGRPKDSPFYGGMGSSMHDMTYSERLANDRPVDKNWWGNPPIPAAAPASSPEGPAISKPSVMQSPMSARMSNRIRKKIFNEAASRDALPEGSGLHPLPPTRIVGMPPHPPPSHAHLLHNSRTYDDLRRSHSRPIRIPQDDGHMLTQRVMSASFSGLEGSSGGAGLDLRNQASSIGGKFGEEESAAAYSAAFTPPGSYADSAPVGSFESNATRRREKVCPPTSYKRLFTLPLKEFQKKRYGINPFRKDEGNAFMQAWTHNRRRWAHAFSSGKVETNITTGYELNYNSLCQPAVLPLYTDYLPSMEDIRTNYTLANYSLLLDSSVCAYRRPEDLLVEMVNQRLAQEYQLLDSSGSAMTACEKFIFDKEEQKNGEAPPQLVVLSMGHRIQFLSYVPSRGTINVHRYMSKIGENTEETTCVYSYQMWSRYAKRFVTTQQTFYQYPEPEYSWNKTDEVLLGNMDTLVETSRPKRLRFAILSAVSNSEADAAYKIQFEKLISFFSGYCDKPEELKITCEEDEKETKGSSATGPDSTHRDRSHKLSVKIWLTPKSKASLPQWAYIQCSNRYSCRRVFHLDIQWHVCIPVLMDKFIHNLFRRFASCPLRLVQVPEYFCATNLQLHPYRPHPIVDIPPLSLACVGSISSPISLLTLKEYPSPLTIIERLVLMQEEADWIPDDPQRTNWADLGLPEPTCNTEKCCPKRSSRRRLYAENGSSSVVGGAGLDSLRLIKVKASESGSTGKLKFFGPDEPPPTTATFGPTKVVRSNTMESCNSVSSGSDSLDMSTHSVDTSPEELDAAPKDNSDGSAGPGDKSVFRPGSFNAGHMSSAASTLLSTAMQTAKTLSASTRDFLAPPTKDMRGSSPYRGAPTEHAQGGAAAARSIIKPRAHLGNQYMHRIGYAAVRVGASCFVWLPSRYVH